MDKKNEFRKIIEVSSVYIGLVLGAGFASGQEIMKFFVHYDIFGILGLVLAGAIFSIAGWAIMNICVKFKIKNYNAFLKLVFGDQFGGIIDYTAAFFILVLFCAMLAGAGATVQQSLNINFSIGVILIAALVFITLLFDLEGIVKVNVVLSPILIVGGIFFGLYTFFTDYTPVFLEGTSTVTIVLTSWVVSAITYASYNMITVVSVLSNMSEVVTSKKVAKYSGIIGGLALTSLGLCFALPLLVNKELVAGFEIPMLALANNHGVLMEILYGVILFSAIFTTAVSTGFSAVKWLLSLNLRINDTMLKFLFVALSAVLAHIGFSGFINTIYPIFGIVGMFEIIVIVLFSVFVKEIK